jgi:hypothetical protein
VNNFNFECLHQCDNSFWCISTWRTSSTHWRLGDWRTTESRRLVGITLASRLNCLEILALKNIEIMIMLTVRTPWVLI